VVVEIADEAHFRLVARLQQPAAASSTTVAVVLAAYCGYIGTIRMRLAPSAFRWASTSAIDGEP
jgi:hypothetical protein